MLFGAPTGMFVDDKASAVCEAPSALARDASRPTLRDVPRVCPTHQARTPGGEDADKALLLCSGRQSLLLSQQAVHGALVRLWQGTLLDQTFRIMEKPHIGLISKIWTVSVPRVAHISSERTR
jgi:hypothetical protein